MDCPAIEVQDLVIEYKTGRRAVDGVTFSVQPGECVGFVGVNGAGKSSTIKTLLGFHFPTSGSVRVLGSEAGTVESRQRVGYLPEVALYYPFMKARELLELYGGLQGLSARELRRRIPVLLEEVGLGGRAESPVRSFSKGMQQRLGIAQAIIAEPELMIFDELSSGLDPVGKYDLHRVLLRHKEQGKTIFFSSHDLSDVEHLCDRIIMIHAGRLIHQATLAELLRPLNEFRIVFDLPGGVAIPHAAERLKPGRWEGAGARYRVATHSADDFAAAVSALSAAGAVLVETGSRTTSLEDEFIRLVHRHGGAQGSGSEPAK